MASIGAPLDRVDGRLKVTGTARYAAEFTLPGLVHAVLVQSTIAAGGIAGFDLAEAQGMPGVLTIITPDNAPKLPDKKDASQAVNAPLLQNNAILYNGQHVAVVVADTLDRALAAAARVRVHYHTAEQITSMDAVLGQAYVPKHFRNGERSPDSNRGDPARSVRQRRGETGCDLRHTDRAPQPDGATRYDRPLGGRQADGVDGDARHFRRAEDARRVVRHRPEAGAGGVPLRRRWVRLQGQHLASRNAGGDGGESGGKAGEAGADPRADVHLQRLSPAHHTEAEVRRRRPGQAGIDAA